MERLLRDVMGFAAGEYAAFLFDLDGTVADSMPLHLVAWQQATTEFGGGFPAELFWSWGGIPLPRTVEMLNEQLGYTLPVAATVERKEGLYLEMLDKLQPVAEVVAVLDAFGGKVPMAIVSGSPRESIAKTLGVPGLADRFQVIVGAEDYMHGKPAPEPFLTAARLLGVEAGRCLVFEDGEAGIEAANAAGWIGCGWRRGMRSHSSLRDELGTQQLGL